jgi:integrase
MLSVRAAAEVAVPTGARWWSERAKAYVDAKSEAEEIGQSWTKCLRWVLARFPGYIWPKVGVSPPPWTPGAVTRAMIRRLRDSPNYAPKTRVQYLQALRGFLRSEGLEIAEDRHLWHLEALPRNRRWLTKAQLRGLWEACEDDWDRLVVASEGFNGLRRVELLRLHVRDLNLALPEPTILVVGKGRNGGKPREIPITRYLYGVLVSTTAGKGRDDRVYPWQRTDVDRRLDGLRRRAGIPVRVSSHDLRRTFGRLAYQAGVSLVNLRALYGHESVDQTAHYVGLDRLEQRSELRKFELSIEVPAVPELKAHGTEVP